MCNKLTFSTFCFVLITSFLSATPCDFSFKWDRTGTSVEDCNKTIVTYKKVSGQENEAFKFEFFNVLDNTIVHSEISNQDKVVLENSIPLGAYAVKVTNIATGCSQYIEHGRQSLLTFKKGIHAEGGGMVGARPSTADSNDGMIDYIQTYTSETADDIVVEVYHINTGEMIHTETFEGKENADIDYGFTLTDMKSGIYVAKMYTNNTGSKSFGCMATVSFDMAATKNCNSIAIDGIMHEKTKISMVKNHH